MNPIQWMVTQQSRTDWLPGMPERATDTIMHVCDQTWRTAEEISRLARRSKTHCARLLRLAADCGQVERLPSRGKYPAQFKLPT